MCNFALCGPPYAGVPTRAPPAPSSIAIAHRHCHRWEPAETHSRRTDRLPRLPRRRQLPARLACPALHGKGERIAVAIGRAPFSAPHWQRDPAPTANHPPRARSHPSHWQHLRSTRLQAPRPEPDCREPQLRQRRSRSIVRRRRLRRPAVAWLGAGRCRGAARGSGEAAGPAASLRLRSFSALRPSPSRCAGKTPLRRRRPWLSSVLRELRPLHISSESLVGPSWRRQCRVCCHPP
jgi:hypothetical protein